MLSRLIDLLNKEFEVEKYKVISSTPFFNITLINL